MAGDADEGVGAMGAFLLNAPSDRTVCEPLTVELVGMRKAWVDAMCEHMERDGSYPYVTVISR